MLEVAASAYPNNRNQHKGWLNAVVLFLYMALTLTNFQPVAGGLYIQLLGLLALTAAYFLASVMLFRAPTMGRASWCGLCILGASACVEIFIYGVDKGAIETWIKYLLLVLSFPVFFSIFRDCSQTARRSILFTYIILIILFSLVTEWPSLISSAKPSLSFLGGYNGANLHFFAGLIFLIVEFMKPNRMLTRLAILGGLIMLMILLAATKSRQPVMILLLVLGYFALSMKKGRGSPWKYWVAFGGLSFGFGLLALASGVWDRFLIESQGFAANSPISSVERYLMLVQVFEGLNAMTLPFGQGYGAVVAKFEGVTDSVHNGYVQCIFNGGLLLLTAVGASIYGPYSQFTKKKSPARLFILLFLFANLFDSHLISFQVLWLPAAFIALLHDETISVMNWKSLPLGNAGAANV